MAEVATEEPTTGKQPTEPEVPEGAQKPDAVKNALAAERAAAKEARKRAEAAEAEVQKFRDKDKSEQQKLAEKATEAERRASEAELKSLRYEVAAAKDLPPKWASRLSGTTKEELEADAEALAKELKPGVPGFDGGVRQPVPTDNPDAMIRRMAGR